jgi:hypothetical protein
LPAKLAKQLSKESGIEIGKPEETETEEDEEENGVTEGEEEDTIWERNVTNGSGKKAGGGGNLTAFPNAKRVNSPPLPTLNGSKRKII